VGNLPFHPVIDVAGHVGLSVTLPPRGPIVNELLCFIQNKVKNIYKDTLAELCAEFYSFDVISTAKQLLFTTVKARQRFVTRKGDNKANMSMHDIIRVFLEMDVLNPPMFVARNLADLPPVSADCMDSVKVLTEINTMKAQMKIITKSNQELISILKSSLNEQSNTPPKREVKCHHDLGTVRFTTSAVSVETDHAGDQDQSDDPDDSHTASMDSEFEMDTHVQDFEDVPQQVLENKPASGTPQPVFSRVFTRTKTATSKAKSPQSFSDTIQAIPKGHKWEMRRQQPPKENVLIGNGAHVLNAEQSRTTVLIGTGSRAGLTVG
jgi:hypothetical protein